jgi:hypothetical protein
MNYQRFQLLRIIKVDGLITNNQLRLTVYCLPFAINWLWIIIEDNRKMKYRWWWIDHELPDHLGDLNVDWNMIFRRNLRQCVLGVWIHWGASLSYLTLNVPQAMSRKSCRLSFVIWQPREQIKCQDTQIDKLYRSRPTGCSRIRNFAF